MKATVRLLAIDTRRSVGLWLFALMIGLAWYGSRQTIDEGIELWVRSSARVGLSLVFLGPMAGALSAWVAGRERWRGLEELAQTTPRSPASRAIIRWGAVAAWSAAAYALMGAIIFVDAVSEGAWGAPAPSLVLVGLAAVVACTTLGALVGTMVPNFYAAPIAAVMLFVTLTPFRYSVLETVPGLVRARRNAAEYLSPTTFVEPLQYDVFHGIAPDIGPQLLIWLFGLTGIALAGIALCKQRSWLAAVALVFACGATAFGAVSIVRADVSTSAGRVNPYTPICDERAIPVCVHPAYESVLDETADLVNDLAAPLVGIPGAPIRAEQAVDYWGMQPDGTFAIAAYNLTNGDAYQAVAVARELVQDSRALAAKELTGELTAAQGVVGVWLIQESGRDPTEAAGQLLSPGRDVRTAEEWDEWQAEASSAVDRFSALSLEQRRTWLEENFIALRAGEVPLEDLP